MYEEDTSTAPVKSSGSGSSLLRNGAIALAVIYVAASLLMIFQLHTRLKNVEISQKAAAETIATHNTAIMKRLGMTEASLEQASHALQSKIGQTQKEVATRTSQLAKQQQATEQRISAETAKITQDVGGVRTEVAGAKTDIAATKTDLENTKSKLERAIGDLNVQSGLIAHTRDELDYVKHRGDRNIYEFTLKKGESPKPVSTISLQLKKVDAKKGKFSMNVLADDRTIEKKDRTVFEPMQFYTGRDRSLFEVVVMTADKNTISGYLSTPKTLAAPASN
jgi:hypothetical protein